MSSTPALAPLPLAPAFFEKVWGGRALEKLGKALPDGKLIGESWELADMPSTSASGAGGGAVKTAIASGPFAGHSPLDLIKTLGHQAILGSSPLSDDGAFPLLVKFLDARENLSVQVHPSPQYAQAHPDCKLKTECWYILHAEPGSVIYKGLKPGVTMESFAEAIAENQAHLLMESHAAIVGECHNLPSGTIHALGAGVVVAEVQTPSDTTFRVYDWGRTGRALHIQQALPCIDFGPPPEAAKLTPSEREDRLVSTPYFNVDELLMQPKAQGRASLSPAGRCICVIALDGEVTLTHQGVHHRFPAGKTYLVPASIAMQCSIANQGAVPARCLVAEILG